MSDAADAYEPEDYVERPHVTCTRCGRVSFAVGRAEGAKMAREARRHYLRRHPAQLGRAPSLASGMFACLCGGTAFRPALEGDCPPGCTICPVVWEPGVQPALPQAS